MRDAAEPRGIVIFDGVCNLCNAAVRFIAANDPAGHFVFLSLQSPRAEQLLREHPATRTDRSAAGPNEPDTVVLLDHGRRYELSDAALHVALRLRMPWPLLFAAILVPRELRDAAYRWIARNRYRWFGRMDACPLPAPGLRERFLDDAAGQAEPSA